MLLAPNCTGNEVFTYNGTYDNCALRNGKDYFIHPSRNVGCFCKPGFIRKYVFDTDCIPAAQCPSKYKQKNYDIVSTSWLVECS